MLGLLKSKTLILTVFMGLNQVFGFIFYFIVGYFKLDAASDILVSLPTAASISSVFITTYLLSWSPIKGEVFGPDTFTSFLAAGLFLSILVSILTKNFHVPEMFLTMFLVTVVTTKLQFDNKVIQSTFPFFIFYSVLIVGYLLAINLHVLIFSLLIILAFIYRHQLKFGGCEPTIIFSSMKSGVIIIPFLLYPGVESLLIDGSSLISADKIQYLVVSKYILGGVNFLFAGIQLRVLTHTDTQKFINNITWLPLLLLVGSFAISVLFVFESNLLTLCIILFLNAFIQNVVSLQSKVANVLSNGLSFYKSSFACILSVITFLIVLLASNFLWVTRFGFIPVCFVLAFSILSIYLTYASKPTNNIVH